MNNLRIGGLASGMDIDQIVSDLMKAERTKVDKLEQDKQLIKWKQELYQEINLDFANFILDTKKEFGLTSATSTGTLVNKSVDSLDWVKSATSSNENIATVSANSSAVRGTYNITVDRLAESFSSASSSSISIGDKSNIASQFNLVADATKSFEIKFTIETNKGSKTFTYTNLDTVSLNDIVKDINSADLGVTAVYDSTIDRFFLQTDNTGSSNWIKITDDSSTTITDAGGQTKQELNFITGTDSLLKLTYNNGGLPTELADDVKYSGVDAQIDFGEAKDIVMSSNQFTINGINFNLKSTGSFTVQVDTDVDAVYNKIKTFVEKYNEIVEKVSIKLSEKRYRDYKPLTKEQKEQLSEKEVELWEKKAKSGLLRSDSILSRTMYNIRSGLYEQVSGVTGSYDQLTEIGITTESYISGSTGGKLVIDEAKLKTAIQNDVDGVLELLFKEPSEELRTKSESNMTAAEIQQKRSESGLINRLYDNMIAGMKEIINKSGPGDNSATFRDVKSNMLIDFITKYSGISMLDKDISNIDDKIDDMYDYLDRVEDRYWRQFTAMEKAISQMNQQSMWLMSQFGGGM
ncbi:flagellar filament capping protein FliD [Caloranaerobacter azorensis]|uniref:Flagellar hook-associated protein 2 n=1 Tax=Caloranaerobacter azorensis TaxID=116090 RepID=A0A6P1YEX9_9FIRM|nr:flagellar filament capping protein FliD [Caloranaerobacter azorensis]QIB27492.1 flagellar filament capping protein FliD [Caloranaerobacter azorensis]